MQRSDMLQILGFAYKVEFEESVRQLSQPVRQRAAFLLGQG
jgi:hypothetical protein